ncbi:MAG: regulatory protein RecX [Pelomonas sp.]|nr:regulatory protein RecX [Roseateles sp.]
MAGPLSLKARAVALLAQREHGAAELRRKLLRIARERARAALAEAADTTPEAATATDPAEPPDPSEDVDALLAWLQAQGYLDETRFVESRVHARAARFGTARISQELARHGLALPAEQQAALKAGEFERARLIWQRKFGAAPPADAAARARQARFLAGRGFSGEVVRRLLRGGHDELGGDE